MKKIIITLLGLTSLVFAGDNSGAADELAACILSLIAFVAIMFFGGWIIAAVGAIFFVIGECIKGAWEKLNSAGRAVFFGIPLFILTTTIFYLVGSFMYNYGFPFVIEYWNWCLCVVAVMYYISTWKTGFDENCHCGNYKVVSRLIATFPFIPVIVLVWAIINGLGKLFVRDYVVYNIWKIWNPYLNYFNYQANYYADNHYNTIKDNQELLIKANKQCADTKSFAKLGTKVSWIFDSRINELSDKEIKQIDTYYKTYFSNWYNTKMDKLQNNKNIVNEICMK